MQLKVPLYDFQREGVAFALSRRYSLNGDKMGLGKTAQALALACEVEAKRVLVVCPAFLVHNWKNEIEKFIGAEHAYRFTAVSYDSIHRLGLGSYDLVIADECHYIKSMYAKRTKAFHAFLETCEPKYFLGLSGTPIKNSVPEFYSLLRACWLGGDYPDFDHYSGSHWLFNHEFTHKKVTKYGSQRVTKFEGVRNVEKLRALIKPVYIRRKTEEVLSLPPQIRQEILIADKAETDQALEAAWDSYQGGKDVKNFSSGKAVSALAKADFTTELVKEMLPEVGQVVVFTDHVQAASRIAEGFSPRDCRTVTGSTTMADRAAAVDALNAGDTKVLVATLGALSVGVNLTGCSHMVFNDVGWVPADLDQAEARIHRIGQAKTCVYKYVLASKVDQMILQTVKKKRALIAEVGT